MKLAHRGRVGVMEKVKKRIKKVIEEEKTKAIKQETEQA